MGFKLKSGNNPTFKNMGASPVKTSAFKATTEELKAEAEANVPEGRGFHEDAASGRTNPDGTVRTDERAYGGDRTWAEGQEASGGTLNEITNNQKAYERKMAAENPDWNKREDNTWKTNQNKINKALGSSKVYDTIKENKTKTVDGVEVMKGLGAKKGKTLTEDAKQQETIKRDILTDQVDRAREENDRDARDLAQAGIGASKAGEDDKYTGTAVSRAGGRIKKGFNEAQLAIREKNRQRVADKIARKRGKGKDTTRLEDKYTRKGGDVSALTKRTKTLGKEDDYKTQQVRNPRTGLLENAQKDTLTTTNKKGEVVRKRDITAKRADRIRKRQARKTVKKQAKQDVRNSGKNETDQQQEDRINRDFPADFGTEGYTGPSLIELQERHKITDKATPGGGKKKNQLTDQEIADYKKEHNLP